MVANTTQKKVLLFPFWFYPYVFWTSILLLLVLAGVSQVFASQQVLYQACLVLVVVDALAALLTIGWTFFWVFWMRKRKPSIQTFATAIVRHYWFLLWVEVLYLGFIRLGMQWESIWMMVFFLCAFLPMFLPRLVVAYVYYKTIRVQLERKKRVCFLLCMWLPSLFFLPILIRIRSKFRWLRENNGEQKANDAID